MRFSLQFVAPTKLFHTFGNVNFFMSLSLLRHNALTYTLIRIYERWTVFWRWETGDLEI